MQRLSLAVAVMLALKIASSAATVIPPTEVQEKVRPILDFCLKAEMSKREGQNKAFWEAARLTGKLFQDQEKSSDEALIVLLNFYVGEATGEDVLHHVTVRGKRTLPLLLKYRDTRPIFPNKDYASILLPPDVRTENFDEAINSIKAGKIIGED